VLGRPLGFDAEWVAALTDRGVHLHLHGQVDAPGPKGSRLAWWDEAMRRAPDRLHLHPVLEPADWVRALSRYDAGWLHRVASGNHGDLRRATWDDLNSPARLPVLLMGGLPLLLPDNRGHRVAVDRITADQGTGLAYADADDVARLLTDPVGLAAAHDAALAVRGEHTFEAHVDRLLDVFASVRR
jgi:hypothetical protein